MLYIALRDDVSIIIKETDKGSGVVVWDRMDYLVEAKNNLMIRKFTKELREDLEEPLEKILEKGIRKLFTDKIFFPLLRIILSHLHQTLSRTLKIPMISYLNWLTFLLYQMMLYYVQ